MSMDSACYTIMYNDNSVMYHELRHELYYTDTTIIMELNSILMAHLRPKKLGYLCCKISMNVSTCNINITILHSIHIYKYLVVHKCL